MTDSLPSPPASRPTSPKVVGVSTDDDDLVPRLDRLLEQYLNLLDQYTSLRKELSTSLSDGFFSLAHAQRISNLGVGRRYGQDGYDGRMKASRRVDITHAQAEKSAELDKETIEENKTTASPETCLLEYEVRVAAHEAASSHRQPSIFSAESSNTDAHAPKIFVEDKDNMTAVDDSETTESTPRNSKVDPAFRDPATWYSILVPQSLRRAQYSFSTSVSDTLPQLLNVVASMEALEKQIWNLRGKLNTRHENES